GLALGLAGTARRRADQSPRLTRLTLWGPVAPTLAGDRQCQGQPVGGAPLVAQRAVSSACSLHLSGAGRGCCQSVYGSATGPHLDGAVLISAPCDRARTMASNASTRASSARIRSIR